MSTSVSKFPARSVFYYPFYQYSLYNAPPINDLSVRLFCQRCMLITFYIKVSSNPKRLRYKLMEIFHHSIKSEIFEVYIGSIDEKSPFVYNSIFWVRRNLNVKKIMYMYVGCKLCLSKISCLLII